jgi:hypothetical protein
MTKEIDPFALGYAHALERGPKSMESIKFVAAFGEKDAKKYQKGVVAGLNRIVENTQGNK